MDDPALLAQVEALALAPEAFGHREHVRLAFAALRAEGDFAAGAARFRRALLRFATAAGAPGKFHETITWAYLALVHERMHRDPCATSLELLARHPDLGVYRGGALARHYDLEALIASPVARAVFVLPVTHGDK